MAVTQDNRFVKVKTDLGDDVLLLRQMSGAEQLSSLFEYHLELFSEDINIQHEKVLGQKLTLTMDLEGGGTRFFNGYVTSFSLTGYEGDFVLYQAEIKPWFWFLTRNSDCRIFQNLTVEEIINEVCSSLGFSDIEFHLEASYRKWKYCVQYRETDFNFLCRLMEQEGMYFYFSHAENNHTLIIVDSAVFHESIANYETIPFILQQDSSLQDQEYIQDWRISKQVQSGAYVLNDFDFQIPKKDLLQKSSVSRDYPHSKFEIYDFPGEYWEVDPEGQNSVKSRIEELQAQYEVLFGSGNAKGITTGAKFELSQYPREDQNRNYLLVSCTYNISLNLPHSRGSENTENFNISFRCIDLEQQFRAPRITSKPCITGLQSAIVVGTEGDEIYTDKWGRVKVQFHWDRYGTTDENSSCWVRVAQVWAGKGWGAVFTPRIGQEVLVSFVEGDPDRPIIVGRVYNNDNMPPYDLPANATQSGFLTRSSKGGVASNANEFRFEDKSGSEEVYLHAEKDQNISVENCETHSVGVNRSKTVGNNETKSIGNNETITIGNNETKQVAKNRSVTIGSNKTETIAINKAETIGVSKELTIGAAYQVTVGGIMNETVGAAKAQEVALNKATMVGGNVTEKFAKNQTVSVGKNLNETIGDSQNVKVAKNLVIDVGDSIVIKTGKSSITMKKDGTIQIVGKDILVKGSGEIDIKASKNITMKGQKILQN